MKEYVAGRAHVDDTPELDRYYADLESGSMGALWTVANAIEPWHPVPSCRPVLRALALDREEEWLDGRQELAA